MAPIRELTTLGDLDRALDNGVTSMRGWRVADLDLTTRGPLLTRLDAHGAIFFGCAFDPDTELALRAVGALIFPELPDLPFAPCRSALYEPAELYDTVLSGGHYRDIMDARCYRWFLEHRPADSDPDVADTLATALHDHAISDAFADMIGDARQTVPGRSVVAVMEATNLGAWLAGASDDALTSALDELAKVPAFAPNVHRWVLAALAIRARYPQTGVASVSVPTWHFGHEPPNVFAGGIAKFFSNAIREDVLLRGATAA